MALSPNIQRQEAGKPISARVLREMSDRADLAARDARTRDLTPDVPAALPKNAFWAWITDEYENYTPHRYAFEEIVPDDKLLWRPKAGGVKTLSVDTGYALELYGRSYAAEKLSSGSNPTIKYRTAVLMTKIADVSGVTKYIFRSPLRRRIQAVAGIGGTTTLAAGSNTILLSPTNFSTIIPAHYPQDNANGIILETSLVDVGGNDSVGGYTIDTDLFRLFRSIWVIRARLGVYTTTTGPVSAFSFTANFLIEFRSQTWQPASNTWGSWSAWSGGVGGAMQSTFPGYAMVDTLSMTNVANTFTRGRVVTADLDYQLQSTPLKRYQIRLRADSVAFTGSSPTYGAVLDVTEHEN